MTEPEPAKVDGMTTTPDLTGWRAKVREHLGDVDPATLPAVPDGETAEDKAERLRLQAVNRANRWTKALPPIYTTASLADLDRPTVSAMNEWVERGGMNLVLAGQVGTGKTHAAYALGHHLVSQGRWVEAWSVVDLLDALKPGREADAESRARECQVLILDDLGAARPTEWAIERMLALLDDRVRDMKPTIWTTNATSDQLYEAWTHRLLDRMAFRRTVIKFVGESRRKADW
jgi:DNA replication protein DnaC